MCKRAPFFFVFSLIAFNIWAHTAPKDAILSDSISPEVFLEFVRNTASFIDSLNQKAYDPTWLEQKGFYLGTEQDFLNVIAPNEDRNYSMGLSFGFLGPKTNKDYLVLPLFRRWLTGIPLIFVPKKCRSGSIFNEKVKAGWFATFEFKTAGFTPRDLVSTSPVLEDRPYANPLSFGNTLHRLVLPDANQNRKREWHIRTSLHLGIFGTGIGREFQKKAHGDHWFGSTREVPLGWSNQIANGGGLSALYTYAMNTPIKKLSSNEDHNWRIQTIATGELMAGWHTNAAIGVGFKAGWFQTPFWIGNDISSRDISSSAVNPKTRPYGCWFYFRPRLRLVAHNALLNGQLFDFLGKESKHTFSYDQINRAIFEFETGLGVKLQSWTITFEPIAGRSPEFNTSEKRWHFWGTVHFSMVIDKSDPRRKALIDYNERLNALLEANGAGMEEE